LKNLNLFWYLIIFLVAVIVIALPTRTVTTIPEDSMLGTASIITRAIFRADVITQYPNYLFGVSIIGGLALLGVFLNTDIPIKLVNKIKVWNEKSNHTDYSI